MLTAKATVQFTAIIDVDTAGFRTGISLGEVVATATESARAAAQKALAGVGEVGTISIIGVNVASVPDEAVAAAAAPARVALPSVGTGTPSL